MRSWLTYAFITTLLWGVWGAYAGAPTVNGFPETLNYVVWSLTMILPAWVVMHRARWRLKRDARSVWLGMIIGVLGAGGQMILFHAVKSGPTYLIFPIISLSPMVTIALSYFLLKERVGKVGIAGIALAACALPLFDYAPGEAASMGWWFVLSLGVLLAWGLQSYFIRLANATMDAESIFFYMTVSGLAFIPVALLLTDFSQPVNLGWNGPGLSALIQILNAVGALTLVYAFRHGKAIVVSPMVNAGGPLLTSIIAIAIAGVLPGPARTTGIVLALLAALLLALPEPAPEPAPEPEPEPEPEQKRATDAA